MHVCVLHDITLHGTYEFTCICFVVPVIMRCFFVELVAMVEKLFQKNDRTKESKFKSIIANLVVKNDTNGEIKNAKVATERTPEKSFFNFLWLNVAGILKHILI